MTTAGVALSVNESEIAFMQTIETRICRNRLADNLVDRFKISGFRSTLAYQLALAQKPEASTWEEALSVCDIWFRENIDALLRLFRGQYVAVAALGFLDHDMDLGILTKRIRRRYGARPVLIRRVYDARSQRDPCDHFISGLR